MTVRFGPADVKRWAQRGQVSEADAQRVLEPARRGVAVPAEPECIERVPLAEPIEFDVPMELLTENRLRAMLSPQQRGKHIKQQRAWVATAWRFIAKFRGVGGWSVPELPVIVTMTRIGRHMDEHDSLRAAFKHVCDEITVQLGLRNDDTPLVTWRYEQEPPAGRHPSIKIRVEARQ